MASLDFDRAFLERRNKSAEFNFLPEERQNFKAKEGLDTKGELLGDGA